MKYLRFGTHSAIAIITTLITLQYAPQSWRVSGIVAIFLGFLAAELVDALFSATYKMASCDCSETMKEVARIPKQFYNQCGICGA